MMEGLRAWMLSLITVSMLLSVIQAVTPPGGVKKIASLLGGLILLLAMLQPLTRSRLRWQTSAPADMQRSIRLRTEALQKEQESKRRTIIEEKTASYIVKEAERIGISCTVRVKAAADKDGRLRPVSAALSCPRSQQLALYMEKQLGIPQGRQTWNEASG